MFSTQFEIHNAYRVSPLWEVVDMATKRTKADKAQRQADELESKSERRPAQAPKKTPTPEDFSQAAAKTVSEDTEKR
ncbi:MAG: hypothetical protein LAO30_23770 [Acidobacteriia bacterium]|nr:hypothetical protein [Terriglobia bacterium]